MRADRDMDAERGTGGCGLRIPKRTYDNQVGTVPVNLESGSCRGRIVFACAPTQGSACRGPIGPQR